MQNPTLSYAVYAFVAIILIVIITVITYFATLQAQPSDANLAALVKIGTTNANIYPKHMPNRKGLYDYLSSIGKLSADSLALSNFYVMTANLGGFFTPVNKAAFCTEAIQYAIQGGARCIIFDIWPHITKGVNTGPILKVCANDKSLQKLSYYTLNLRAALTTVRTEAFENSANPCTKDPMFLYFRFRGTVTEKTLSGTADAISGALEQYRLPIVYTSTNSNPLYSTPITEFYSKVIILSNQSGVLKGVRTRFADYVNNPVQPTTPITSISTPGQIHALAGENLTTVQQTTSKYSILACAPLPEDTANSESNSWDWKEAQAAGIQLVGLNMWVMDDGLNRYTDPNMFGTYSFNIKPIELRYEIERIQKPISSPNPNVNNGVIVPP